MTTYYVATLARYVLVEAENEGQAREPARVALETLHAEVGRRLGENCPSTFSSSGRPRPTRLNSANGARRCSRGNGR